jgi:PAS domain S-box-containing protein
MFRELFDIAPDAMVAVDAQGRIVRANAQAERLFGYEPGMLNDAPIEMLMPDRVRATHHRHVTHYAAAPRIRPMGAGQELVGQRRDGSEFPVEIALSPIKTDDGMLYVAAIRDISESQRARQTLVRARYDKAMAQIGQLMLAAPNLDKAVEGIPGLVAPALEVEGVVLALRDTLHERIRIRTSFGISDDVLDTLDQAMAQGLLEQLSTDGASTIFNPAVLGTEKFAFGKDGFMSAAIAPLLDPVKTVGALLVFSREARNFDHDAMHFLQTFAITLTGAIQRIRTEEQLSHAQRLEAVGQLTGGVAHDFNNLLTIISGNLQILEDDLQDRPDALDVIGAARRATARGAELTRKLLAFARRQQLSPQACNPAVLLHDLSGMLKRTLGDAIDLQTHCLPDVPHIFVDPGQLDAALVNLAINARDAMPRGGRLNITISLGNEADANEGSPGVRYVVLTVSDTGIGMPPDVLARAFEPFFTTKEQGKGTGLGLSMVYGFVKQSGGHLAIESRLGYGTKIALHLPAIDAPAPSAVRHGHAGNAAHGDETILVVEDEADVRSVASRFLRSFGYRVVEAAEAESALAIAENAPGIVLVFSDVMLGSGMTGIELAHALLRIRPELPVVLTSGDERSIQSSDDSDRPFALLKKPYLREDLSQVVREAIDRSRIARTE